MKRFRVKVCGITRPEDAAVAIELGCDMIGMILSRTSPRFVVNQKALAVTRLVPSIVAKVGVFVGAEVDTILRMADRLKLDFVQLHGGESESTAAQLQASGVKVIRVFHIEAESDWKTVARSRADLKMVDHKTDKMPGGTGKPFNWNLVPGAAVSNLVLAGGISEKNVAEGVKLFDPVMVDVNSSVETSPGLKSAARLKRFFKECDRLRYG